MLPPGDHEKSLQNRENRASAKDWLRRCQEGSAAENGLTCRKAARRGTSHHRAAASLPESWWPPVCSPTTWSISALTLPARGGGGAPPHHTLWLLDPGGCPILSTTLEGRAHLRGREDNALGRAVTQRPGTLTNHENYLYCDGAGEPIPGLVCIVSHPCARELDAKGVRTIRVPARLAPLYRDRPPSRRHESQVCLPRAIHQRPPEAPVRSAELTEASQLSGVLQPPPPTFPKDGSPGLWSQGRSRTQNRACGLTMGLHRGKRGP